METVIRYVTLFRTLWICGRYGGGKTAFSVALALEMVNRKHANKIVTNVPLTIGTPIAELREREVHDVQDAVLILDEAWLMLPQGASANKTEAWLAFLRKGNQHLILPSVLPLSRQVSHFVMERSYNAMPLGLAAWIYRWRLKGGSLNPKHDTVFGWYWWWNPSKIFGVYDHLARPGEIYYVYEFIT